MNFSFSLKDGVINLFLFLVFSGLAFYMHRISLGGWVLLAGFVSVALAAFFCFWDIAEEASAVGYHTLVVKQGWVFGFLLFWVSEIMLFFGFFWALSGVSKVAQRRLC